MNAGSQPHQTSLVRQTDMRCIINRRAGHGRADGWAAAYPDTPSTLSKAVDHLLHTNDG